MNYYKYYNIKKMYDQSVSASHKKDQLFRIIAAVDNGEQWSISNKKIRKNQSLPVTNILSNIRDTRHGSLSVTGFIGEFHAKTVETEDMAIRVTEMMSSVWKQSAFDEIISDALYNALTFGTGITMVVGKDTGPKNEYKYVELNDIQLVNIDPTSFYVENGIKSESEANYFFYKDVATLDYLRIQPLFKNTIKKNEGKIMDNLLSLSTGSQGLESGTSDKSNVGSKISDYILYVGKIIRADGRTQWDMVYLFGGIIIGIKEDIQPSEFPFVFMREIRDKNSFWGQSSFKKNLPLQISINELDSMVLTYTKQQQNPVSIISRNSNINPAIFARYKDNPNASFLASGDARSAVEYKSLPNMPTQITQMSTLLIDRIQKSTGSAGVYSGNETGSIQTTGGISQVLQRSVLKDYIIVTNLQKYLRNLYQLIIEHLKLKTGVIRYSTFNRIKNDLEYKTLDLEQIPWDDLELVTDIFHHTGSAKESNRMVMEQLYQNSLQYQSAQPITEPVLLTLEEYLEGISDLNINKLIVKIQNRRQKERELDMAQSVTQIIVLYLEIVQKGVTPEEAIIMVAQEYANDPGVLKGLKVQDMAREAANDAKPGGQQGQNQG